MNDDPAALLPELLLLAGAVAGLLTGMFVPRGRQRAVAWICAAALAAALAATVTATVTATGGAAFGSYAPDALTQAARAVVAGGTLLVIALVAAEARGHRREAEAYVLVMLAALGSVLLAGAGDLLVLVPAYLLASIPAYALAGFGKDAPGTEAALKYYLMGAFLGVLMLAGVTLLYGLAGATGYRAAGAALALAPGAAAACGVVLLLAGLLFKAGGVPAHFWVPDVAEGAPVAVAAFVTTVPKIGALAALLRVADELGPGGWDVLVAIVAAATMTLGNLAAFHQDDVRRLLAYSTISQAGYVLVPVAVAQHTALARPAVLFYLAAYAVTNVGAFAVVAATGRGTLDGYRGLGRAAPGLGLALVVCLLGFAGIPPAAVFVAKVLVFAAAWDGGYAWLAVLVLVNTVASLYYYLRWVAVVFRGDPPAAPPPGLARAVACVAAVASLALGVGGGVLLGRAA
ncbi:NADH-quinone oxidoreductase subunit N [Nonomuraea sp. NPDC049725]|uniref:NADH-quinone oxidoreductase subunit N n=1 Tax=Nonomuraea sp. NPDC049725 TaxID=3154508 RepID=UPI00342A0519